MSENIWSKDGTAYQKGGFIYSWQEAANRGFVSKNEADSHNKDKDDE